MLANKRRIVLIPEADSVGHFRGLWTQSVITTSIMLNQYEAVFNSR